MHRFRDNNVFLQTGNVVTVISPLRALHIIFDDGFWKGDTKFIFMLYGHILPIFNRLRVNSTFCGRDFPAAGEIGVVFGENNPQKV